MFDVQNTVFQPSNTASINNKDGTWTLGTTDYGHTYFGHGVVLPAGVYRMSSPPTGYYAITTSLNHADTSRKIIMNNSTDSDLIFSLEEAQQWYFMYFIGYKPSSPITIRPYVYKLRSNYNYICPDDFNGVDREKVQQAFNYFGSTGSGVIVINRMYNLDNPLFINHQTYNGADTRITVIGLGDNCGFNLNSWWIRGAMNATSVRNYGGITFQNIHFTGNEHLFNFTNLIRIVCDNCTFDKLQTVGYSTQYIQTFHMINCLFRNISDSILKMSRDDSTSYYDVSIKTSLIEYCNKVVDCARGYQMVFDGNAIEGMWDVPFTFRNDAFVINIVNNYFEQNASGFLPDKGQDKGSINIDLSGLTGEQSINITGNMFSLETSGKGYSEGTIVLPEVSGTGKITISGNSAPWGGRNLIKVPETVDTPYSNVVLLGNYGEINDPNLTVFNMDDKRYHTYEFNGQDITVYRVGSSVTLQANNLQITSSSGYISIVTDLHAGFIPDHDVDFLVFEAENCIHGLVTTSGEVKLYLSDTSVHTLNIMFTYTV